MRQLGGGWYIALETPHKGHLRGWLGTSIQQARLEQTRHAASCLAGWTQTLASVALMLMPRLTPGTTPCCVNLPPDCNPTQCAAHQGCPADGSAPYVFTKGAAMISLHIGLTALLIVPCAATRLVVLSKASLAFSLIVVLFVTKVHFAI